MEFSILWGLGATFIMKVIHPLIAAAVGKVPVFAGGIMLCAFGAVLIFDLAATLLALRKMLKNLRLLSALAREVRSVSDKIGESISGGTLVVKEGAETAFEPYSDLAELRRAHKAEEAALAERHRAEEQALLESVLATEKARRSESREAKAGEQRRRLDSMKAELAEKLAAARKSSKHFLKAFPGFKSAEYQDIVEKLRKK